MTFGRTLVSFQTRSISTVPTNTCGVNVRLPSAFTVDEVVVDPSRPMLVRPLTTSAVCVNCRRY